MCANPKPRSKLRWCFRREMKFQLTTYALAVRGLLLTGWPRASWKKLNSRWLRPFGRGFIIRALRQHKGNITYVATEIGLRRRQVQQKFRELGLKDW